MHAADPFTLLYLPALQLEQGPPWSPVAPTLHLQSSLLSLPTGESDSKGHVSHEDAAVAPDLFEYLPESQFLHGALPASVLNLPAGH